MPTGSTGQIVGIVIASLLVIGLGSALSVYFGRRVDSSRAWLSADGSLPLVVVIVTQFATATGGGVLIAHVGIATAVVGRCSSTKGACSPASCC